MLLPRKIVIASATQDLINVGRSATNNVSQLGPVWAAASLTHYRRASKRTANTKDGVGRLRRQYTLGYIVSDHQARFSGEHTARSDGS